MPALGRHLLAELKTCEASRLADLPLVQEAMVQAARVSGATVVTQSFHHFAPLGISGVVVVAESHLAIHTWPEHCFAAVDYFTCGKGVDPLAAIHHLRLALGAQEWSLREIPRGEL